MSEPVERFELDRPSHAFERDRPFFGLAKGDDLIGAAMLLCSDAGRYINGVNLFVDGGRAAV